MPTLFELQSRMMNALLGSSMDGGVPLVALSSAGADHEMALARLRVYRNNVQANFVESLHSSYPAVWRLMGEDYFHQIALQFHARCPSRSGDLLHVGALFPDFLSEVHRTTEFGYFADVARLEWVVQETLLAADHAPFDVTKLARVEPSAYDDLRFELHPALRLFESIYPALSIREMNLDDDNEPQSMDLRVGGDRVAVMRRLLRLEFHQLDPGEYAFLEAVQHGKPFAAAVDAGATSAVAFNAASTLQRFVALEVIVDFIA